MLLMKRVIAALFALANHSIARVLHLSRSRAFQGAFHVFTIAPATALGFFDVPPDQIAGRQAHDQNNNDCIQNPSFPSAAFTLLIISLIPLKVQAGFKNISQKTSCSRKSKPLRTGNVQERMP